MDTTKRIMESFRPYVDMLRPYMDKYSGREYYVPEHVNPSHSENLKKCKSCKHCKKENYRAHCSEKGFTVDLLQPACERYAKKKN